jgi:hypothetical protein
MERKEIIQIDYILMTILPNFPGIEGIGWIKTSKIVIVPGRAYLETATLRQQESTIPSNYRTPME